MAIGELSVSAILSTNPRVGRRRVRVSPFELVLLLPRPLCPLRFRKNNK